MSQYVPDCDEQVAFLRNIQALLEDGGFVSTYKYALLHALCDVSVECSPARDGSMRVTLASLAGKFIDYYWRQSADYCGGGTPGLLQQSDGNQASIVNRLALLRGRFATLAKLHQDAMEWTRLVGFVAGKIKVMPLFRLQTIGGVARPFLYENEVTDGAVVLKPGVAYCLAQFHALVSGLARDHWMRKVAQIASNRPILASSADLEDFLFGAERQALVRQAAALADLQNGECFYCGRALSPDSTHVDHFVPWSLYRMDALPNLVAADATCNARKRDWLAGSEHVARWRERNEREIVRLSGIAGYELGQDRQVASAVARWAYRRAVELGQNVWLRGREVRFAGDAELLALA